jgi:hypothetical protein
MGKEPVFGLSIEEWRFLVTVTTVLLPFIAGGLIFWLTKFFVRTLTFESALKAEKEAREKADESRDKEQRRVSDEVQKALGKIELLDMEIRNTLLAVQSDLAYIKGGLDATGTLKPRPKE